MSVIGIIAIVACLASVAAKLFFTLESVNLEKRLDVERASYQAARKEWNLAAHRYKVLKAEHKQLETKRSSIQRNVGRLEKSHGEFVAEERKDETIRARQKELLETTRKKADRSR